jgi:hypothetical protein
MPRSSSALSRSPIPTPQNMPASSGCASIHFSLRGELRVVSSVVPGGVVKRTKNMPLSEAEELGAERRPNRSPRRRRRRRSERRQRCSERPVDQALQAVSIQAKPCSRRW